MRFFSVWKVMKSPLRLPRFAGDERSYDAV
jgi:hypothetical protein